MEYVDMVDQDVEDVDMDYVDTDVVFQYFLKYYRSQKITG